SELRVDGGQFGDAAFQLLVADFSRHNATPEQSLGKSLTGATLHPTRNYVSKANIIPEPGRQ
ncbi:hypothetical protein, partial [Mycobacterium celatum]|uniref:hypothetical protein n=1 Tax=Mycobacterium celatum TaxID=28045 RepID=UPI001E5BB327